MEKRKLSIVVDERGWHITSNQKATRRADDELDPCFACVNFADEKISFLSNHYVADYMIEVKSKYLNEVCIFTHDEHSFMGSFRDALKYIEVEFKKVYDEKY